MDIIRFIKGKESSIQVPKGTYDLYAEFLGDKHSYVFRENIQATEDQVIEIDQDEANIPIEFHYLTRTTKSSIWIFTMAKRRHSGYGKRYHEAHILYP